MTFRTPTAAKAALLAFGLVAALPFSALPGLAETAVAPEKNPPGDIPDSQAFITYSADLYALKVPEGWARTVAGPNVSFASKLDGVSVTVTDAATAPTLETVKAQYVPAMVQAGRAVTVTKISAETLPAGGAIKISYSANSEPNPVTNKQIRLENARYLFWKAGKLAALDLYAPLGADNVDQWNLMSQSFGWH